MTDPQTRARTAIATALGIAWPAAVPLRDGRVWLTSRYDVLPAQLAESLQTYLARRAADQVRDERIVAEAVALLGAESARSRNELPGLGAAAALDRLLAAPGLDQSQQDEARAMLRVALRSAAEESPEAAARLLTFPGDARSASVTRVAAAAQTISRTTSGAGASGMSAGPQRRLSRRRTLTRAVDATSLVPTIRSNELTSDIALQHLASLTADDVGLNTNPTVDSGLVVLQTASGEQPQHVRVEIASTVGTLLAQGRLSAGTPEDPHVLRISPNVADAQLAQIWTHQISLMTQEVAAERTRPTSMLGRLRYAFGPERRDIRLRADFATYQLLSKEWRQAQVTPGRPVTDIRRDLEGLATTIKRRGGALPELPWGPDARSAPDAIALGRAAERLRAANPPTALRQQVVNQIGELESSVAELTKLADKKVTTAAEATTEAADLQGKALAEEQLRDLGAPERARGFRVEAVAASNKAQRHIELAGAYRQAAEDAQHTLTGYRDLQTAIETPGTPPAELTALATEAADRAEVYEASTAQAMPVKDVLETGVPTGPPLLVPTDDINRALTAQGIQHRLDDRAPRAIPNAEYRRLMSKDGMVVPVGPDFAQVRLKMKRRDFTEVADRDYDLAEQMTGTVGAGGQGVGITSSHSSTTSYGVNLQPLLAAAPPGSVVNTIGQVIAPRGDVTHGKALTQGSGFSQHGQFGHVDDDRGESLLYQWTGEWEIEVRNSPTEPWSTPETADAGQQLTWVPSAYTVKPPAKTVTLKDLGRGDEVEKNFPPHTVNRINGLQVLSDRLVSQVPDLDRVGYDQINGMITGDTTRLLHEFTKPGGFTRPISVDGRPGYELTLEFEPVWSTAKLSGESSNEVWKEAVEVDFSGINASENYSTSVTATAGVGLNPLHNVGSTTLDVTPGVGAGRNVSHSGGQNVSTTAITPTVHRDQGPTQGVLVDFKVKATLRKLTDRKADPIVVDDVCEGRLRITENDLLRAGGPAAAAAVRRDEAGATRFDQDGRALLRGDPEPPTGPQTLPPWLGDGPNQMRGPGKALASNLQGADQAQLDALANLSAMGLVPPLDDDHQPLPKAQFADELHYAGQRANYDRIVQNITAHRIQAGINQACQGGIPVTLVNQHTGRTPEYRHFRLGVEQDFNDVTGRGTTPGRNVVRLGIASGATSRSSSRSRSMPLSAGVNAADGPNSGLRGLAGKFGLKLNRNALGRSLSWTSGRRVNRVTLTESTEPLDVLRQGVRITFRELGQAEPIADVQGSVDLAYESSLTRAEPDLTKPAKAPSDLAVRQAITVAVDAGNPADRIFTESEAFRKDSSAVLQLHAALSSESLVAHPDWMNGSFEVPMIVTPPPANPAEAVHDRSIRAQEYKVVLRGRAVDQQFLAVSQQNTANVNLTLTDAGFTSGTSTSGGVGVEGGGGQVNADSSAVLGTASLGRNAGTSESRSTSRATGQEWLQVNTGTHYELLERYELEADIVDSQGTVVQTIPLDDALAQKAMAERRALALYASGKLDLPLPVVADVAERYLNDRVTMEPQVATGFVRRYNKERAGVTTGLAAEHDTEKLVAKVFEASGQAPSQSTKVEERLRATETLAAQRTPVDLGPAYEESLGSAQLESIEGPDGQVNLFELVRPQFEEIAPGVLADSKLLAPALRVNLNPDAFQGSFENMLGPRGFVATVEVPVDGQVPDLYQVRITARYVDSYTVDGTPEIPAVPAIGLDQAYAYRGQEQSVSHSTTYGASAGGSAGDGNVGAAAERSRTDSAGSALQNATVARTGHFDLAEVRRQVVFTSEVVKLRGAGAAAMTSTAWKLGRTTPDERTTVATPRQVTAEVTLHAPRQLIREPGTRPQTAEQVEHRPIQVTESAIVESTSPYGRGDARTNQLYDVLSAELAHPGVLGEAGVAEHSGTLDGYLQATAMKANFGDLTSTAGLRLPPLATRGNGSGTVAVTINARMTGFELAEDPIGDAQTGAVSRRETSAKTSSTGSHLGPGSVNAGASGGPISVSGSVGEQVKEQNSDSYGNRLETSKFEEGELVTVRIPVSYDVTIAKDKRSKEIPDAAKGQYFVKMLTHEYLEALRKMETGASADAALAGAQLEIAQPGAADIRASAVQQDAAGNEVYEPYQPLVDAIAKAKSEQTTVVVSVLDRGREDTYVALPDGKMIGGDRGFGSAFAGLDQRIALMAQNRVDLRQVHNALGPNEDFNAKVAESLVQNGVPASMLKGLDYSTTAQQLRPQPTPKPVTVGSKPAREQERHH
ncbi:hypothetical protein E1263_13160 [Kribbella antibiotica]|uniref:Uncharacterized protein n=1 Tax=Kribbella antibiotica TaxID=190195 RepID=A0A4V2YPZ4_9ACTN|nr:hypothetical protein [Kribbella antibiotica]TDD59877.1 hypothetical protein E1263_13160 [Kribbella antibiotica]